VIRLRQKFPERERGWKPPVSVTLRGVEVPLTAVLGGLGTFSAWIVVMALNPRTLVIGAVWMVVGIGLYLIYRRVQGISARETHKVLLPEPLGVEEVEYHSVLVAFEDDAPFAEETVVTAVKLAAKRRRGIHVISVITVPTHLPLDAPLAEQESEAQSKIEQAKLIAGLRVSGHVHRVRPNQAGHSIAEEAKEMEASALVMGLRYRNGIPLYGKTLQTLLTVRPCRIIVFGEPGRARGPVEPDGGGPPVGAPT
jgi:basic amino acid/polyamine antiporter, APA family